MRASIAQERGRGVSVNANGPGCPEPFASNVVWMQRTLGSTLAGCFFSIACQGDSIDKRRTATEAVG